MDWRQRLHDHARTLRRDVYDGTLGIGIDFEDGCDAFWVLPGEVTSTVPVPAGGPGDVDALLAEYERIGRVRERAVHVLRHYLASQQVRVDRGRGGSWGIELPSGMSTSIAVGAGMTAVARDTGDAYATVAASLKGVWGVKVPSPVRFERHLRAVGPPPGERTVSEPHETPTLFPRTIKAVLALMRLCRALSDDEALKSPAAFIKSVMSGGRISRAITRLGERVPHVKASPDLLKPGLVVLDFDDGHASFDIDTHSRDLARRIRTDGPTVVGDQLADEYLALNAGRSAVLKAIWQAAAARGWRKDRVGGFALLTGAGPTIFLGDTHRDVSFSPGDALTDALRGATPEAAVRKLFAQIPDFAEACVAALNAPAPGKLAEPPEASLRPRDVPSAPPLRELDAATVAEMDRFADETLRAYLAEERTIWDYRKRRVYDPAIDTWATPQDWVRAAEARTGGEWPDPMGIVILLDAGHPRGDELARQYLRRAQPHHEVSAGEVEIAWRYRHEYPDVARQWFLPQGFDDVPFAKERAALGDPVALRKTTLENRPDPNTLPAVDVDMAPEEAARLSPQGREQLHAALLDWARTDHKWAPPQGDRLSLAAASGWPDVAGALEENPYLLAGLLTRQRRPDQFDEPGLLLAKDFILAWSRLAPTAFLARLVVTARATDLVGLAEEASRASAAAKPEAAKHVGSSAEIYRRWLKDLEPALAIAWTRCRAAGVGA